MTYEAVLAFDTDSPEFARGVEVGRLWEQFKDPEAFEQMIHTENVEMVLRVAEAMDRKVTAEALDDEWMLLKVEES